MSYQIVQEASRRMVGLKQTIKAIENGEAIEVVVATDADAKVTNKVIEKCKQKAVKCSYVDSMKQLGIACGIDVGAATVAILK
ncbi:ribosomal L7Ae/L30e/S12e/Gadd45 family protein [Desulfuribacillus alkaliarsenatis]|uniref:Ribosomal protein L7Ae-like protein n=1 Tax=Desulfuribacillus alkaliarsenatis TaxID=766136 RepID=A0A1E5G4C5_9FIRM|nr:ribosomal L7Ae/L30e/S12e/Gadd45 family protein [Desulfuribacillus alkaliarsenatis]OEF97945.1 ribosomal protein L7Ae-like protein [Desulfuribacillus alkaliarsenatis]